MKKVLGRHLINRGDYRKCNFRQYNASVEGLPSAVKRGNRIGLEEPIRQSRQTPSYSPKTEHGIIPIENSENLLKRMAKFKKINRPVAQK